MNLHAFGGMRIPCQDIALLGIVWALAGCGASGDAAPGTGGTAPLVQCAGLDECACAQTPGCAPITTDCWCPPAACGSTAPCPCEGGHFLACSPVGGSCHTSHCPLLAETSAPDAQGCMICASPETCETALTKLAAACPALPETTTRWMCGQDLTVCATFCLGQIRSCASAECALCVDCSCSDDTLGSCVDECLASMANHH